MLACVEKTLPLRLNAAPPNTPTEYFMETNIATTKITTSYRKNGR